MIWTAVSCRRAEAVAPPRHRPGSVWFSRAFFPGRRLGAVNPFRGADGELAYPCVAIAARKELQETEMAPVSAQSHSPHSAAALRDEGTAHQSHQDFPSVG